MMDCLHPVTVSVDTYDNDNHFTRIQKISVPCGKCPSCVVSSANEWRTRLKIEKDHSDSSYFVTLTYDDDSVPLSACTDSFGMRFIAPVVSKRDVQLFLKRLRKKFPFRYFIVSEYGPTYLRPHYHGIFFGFPLFSRDPLLQDSKITKIIEECWTNGFVTVDSVTDGRISYVTKYLTCVQDLPEYLPRPFRLMSRNPGIGASYLSKTSLISWHRDNLACYYPEKDHKCRLPRYLKDKIFDDDMKCEISDRIRSFRSSQLSEDISLSSELGYSNFVDFRHSNIDSFVRKFDRKLKKSRKDV